MKDLRQDKLAKSCLQDFEQVARHFQPAKNNSQMIYISFHPSNLTWQSTKTTWKGPIWEVTTFLSKNAKKNSSIISRTTTFVKRYLKVRVQQYSRIDHNIANSISREWPTMTITHFDWSWLLVNTVLQGVSAKWYLYVCVCWCGSGCPCKGGSGLV